ncbi:hypothetical protein BJ878DRAFT_484033 [Calycina marina]|uniref:Uncharacterized protein n=1 Tax=Calycina marina TaxID=1763456 RepID=A0A9P7YVY6_9HELO|nr:hypothetical protein BJ878DRAFT_484033 [Calycina marina]
MFLVLPFEGLCAGMILSEVIAENTATHVSTIKNFAVDSERFPNSYYTVLRNYEPKVFKNIILTSLFANTEGVDNPPELKKLLDDLTMSHDDDDDDDYFRPVRPPEGYKDVLS